MLIVDIQKLIESINIISQEDNTNLFWIKKVLLGRFKLNFICPKNNLLS